jgi:hypothetical protein
MLTNVTKKMPPHSSKDSGLEYSPIVPDRLGQITMIWNWLPRSNKQRQATMLYLWLTLQSRPCILRLTVESVTVDEPPSPSPEEDAFLATTTSTNSKGAGRGSATTSAFVRLNLHDRANFLFQLPSTISMIRSAQRFLAHSCSIWDLGFTRT